MDNLFPFDKYMFFKDESLQCYQTQACVERKADASHKDATKNTRNT